MQAQECIIDALISKSGDNIPSEVIIVELGNLETSVMPTFDGSFSEDILDHPVIGPLVQRLEDEKEDIPLYMNEYANHLLKKGVQASELWQAGIQSLIEANNEDAEESPEHPANMGSERTQLDEMFAVSYKGESLNEDHHNFSLTSNAKGVQDFLMHKSEDDDSRYLMRETMDSDPYDGIYYEEDNWASIAATDTSGLDPVELEYIIESLEDILGYCPDLEGLVNA